ncbi:MAG: protein kinase [Firmicutes bacterium]|nr:protein kinase [Bacillota bacterium]
MGPAVSAATRCFFRYLERELGIVEVKPFAPPNKLDFQYFTAETPKKKKVFIKLEGRVEEASAREAFFINLLRKSGKAGFFPKIVACRTKAPFAFIATEFIEGQTLAKFLRQNRRNPKMLRPLLEQMCSILEILHGAKVVHRDVRPPNLIVHTQQDPPYLRIVLIDFAYALRLKPPLAELPFVAANTAILKKLGTGYKPREFLWDDAFAFSRIAAEADPDYEKNFPEIHSFLSAKTGKLTYTFNL